jgi:hypothetical protein
MQTISVMDAMCRFPYCLPMTSPLSTSQIDVMSEGSRQSDAGLRLDGVRLRRELRLRGATAGRVAELAEVSPNTLTRAMAGEPITVSSLRAIVRALASLPVLVGVGELLATETRNAAVLGAAAFMESSSAAVDLQT